MNADGGLSPAVACRRRQHQRTGRRAQRAIGDLGVEAPRSRISLAIAMASSSAPPGELSEMRLHIFAARLDLGGETVSGARIDAAFCDQHAAGLQREGDGLPSVSSSVVTKGRGSIGGRGASVWTPAAARVRTERRRGASGDHQPLSRDRSRRSSASTPIAPISRPAKRPADHLAVVEARRDSE